MADYYSVGATKYNAQQKVQSGTWGARLYAYYDTYEAASLASDSILYMFMPKSGMKYAGWGQLAWDDMAGAAATCSVGVGVTLAAVPAVVDAFLAATDVQSAADKADLDAGAAAVTYLAYEFDGGTWVTMTTAGGNAQTGTLKLIMFFFDI
jgi:hypothetical protein